jgi:hypothetical protein
MINLSRLSVVLAITSTAWSANPEPGSLQPTSGSGLTQTFTTIMRHPGGPSQQYKSYMLFLPTPNIVWFVAKGSCLIEYNRLSNGMRLIDDAGTAWSEPPEGVPVAPGTTPLSNSTCTVNVAGSSANFVGNDMLVTIPVTFKAPGLTQVLGTFSQGLDMTGQWSDMRQFGNWIVPGAPVKPGPAIVGASPVQGAGSTATITATASHTSGAGQLGLIHMILSDRIVGGLACHVIYFSYDDTVALIDDAGTGFAGAGRVARGSANTLANSRCSVNVAGATRGASSNLVSITYPMTFSTSTFGGVKSIYLNAFDLSGNLSHWVRSAIHSVQ